MLSVCTYLYSREWARRETGLNFCKSFCVMWCDVVHGGHSTAMVLCPGQVWSHLISPATIQVSPAVVYLRCTQRLTYLTDCVKLFNWPTLYVVPAGHCHCQCLVPSLLQCAIKCDMIHRRSGFEWQNSFIRQQVACVTMGTQKDRPRLLWGGWHRTNIMYLESDTACVCPWNASPVKLYLSMGSKPVKLYWYQLVKEINIVFRKLVQWCMTKRHFLSGSNKYVY